MNEILLTRRPATVEGNMKAENAIWIAHHHLRRARRGGGDRRVVRALEQMQEAVTHLLGGHRWNGPTH